MASSKGYLQFLLDQLSNLEDIAYRSMMGEYILYYRGKIAAYVCEDRLLVKPIAAPCSHGSTLSGGKGNAAGGRSG